MGDDDNWKITWFNNFVFTFLCNIDKIDNVFFR